MVSLLFLLLLCFGPHLATTGFYLDDWPSLSRAMPQGHPDFFASIRAFAVGGFWLRPVEILHYPLLITIGGLSPWRYRLMGLILEWALGGFIFLFLRRLSGSAYLALWAAGLALIYPTHRSTHIWMTNSVPVAAFVLVFLSLWAHLKWRDTRRNIWRVAALGAYGLSLLEYEAAAFLPAALWAGRAAGDWADGSSLSDALKKGGFEMRGFIGVLFAALIYKSWVVPMFSAEPSRDVVIRFSHLFKVFSAALSVSTVETVSLAFDSVKRSGGEFGPVLWALLLPASYGLSRALDAGRDKEKGLRRAAIVLTAVAAAVFVCGYMPFFFTGMYTPRMYGVMNRVNLAGGLSLGMLCAAGFSLIRFGPKTRALIGTLVISVCAVCHWDGGLQWTKAWAMQKEIIGDIREQLPPGPATVVIVSAPPWIHRAPVFKTDYDVTHALWMATGRRDIRGNFAFAGRLEPQGMYVLNGDKIEKRYPYENLYAYNGKTRRVYAVENITSDLGF